MIPTNQNSSAPSQPADMSDSDYGFMINKRDSGMSFADSKTALIKAKKGLLQETSPTVARTMGVAQEAMRADSAGELDIVKSIPEGEKENFRIMTQQYGLSQEEAKAKIEEGGIQDKIGRNIKAGVLTGGEGVQKVGAAITGDTSGLEGYRQFYGTKTPEELDIKQLSPAERGQIVGEGMIDFSSGTLGTAFAPAATVIGEAPVIGEPVTKAFEAVVGEGGKLVSAPVKLVADKLGVELTQEQLDYIDQGGETVVALYMAKMAEDFGKQQASEALGTKIQKAMRSGGEGLSTVKSLIAQYEQSITKPTIAGQIGAGVTDLVAPMVEGVAAIASKPFKVGIKGLKDIKTKVSPDVITKRESSLQKVIDTNKPLRDYVTKQKERGIDVKDTAVNTDFLVNAVDKDGVIRTKQEGGAVSQYRDFLKPQETVVSDILKAEGKTIPLAEVEAMLTKDIMDSGIQGKALTSALKDIKSEIEGYKLKANPDGTVSISFLQDAKIDKYSRLNYMSETAKADKATAGSLKKMIEENTKSADVKALNTELAEHYASIKFLEKLDGVRVKGGKLGGAFAKTVGAIAGSNFGPLGTIAGAEVAGALHGAKMSGTFGKSTGSSIKASPLMKESLAKTQSKKVGNLQTTQAATNKNTTTPIDKSLPQSIDKVKPFKKGVNPPTKGQQKITDFKGFEKEMSLNAKDKAVETAAFEKILKNEDQIIEKCMSDNGKYVSSDKYRPFFKEEGYVGYNAAAVQEPVSYLGKRTFTKTLENDGRFVTATGGGSGVGKSTAVKNLSAFQESVKNSSTLYDSNLSSYKSLIKKVEEAKASGKKFVEYYVYREPLDAFENGVVKRMLGNPEEAGRLVPSGITAKNHIGSWETAKQFEDTGGTVYYVDNSLGKNGAKLVTKAELEAKINYPSVKELTDKFNEVAKRLKKEGKLDQAQLDGYMNN